MNVPPIPEAPSAPRWVPIRRACEILGVNQATLRQWTSQGSVKAFVTPGGHRRYLEADLLALTLNGPRPTGTRTLKTVLPAARQRYHALARQCWQAFPWFQNLEVETRLRFRVLGNAMLNLLSEYLLADSSSAMKRCLHEGVDVATQYGKEAANLGLSSREATEAFLLFRMPVLESINQWLLTTPDPRAPDHLRRFNHFMDTVLVSMVTAHEAGPAPASGQPEAERLVSR